MNVYLDNASTTNVSLKVFEAMKPFFLEQYANPSSLHDNGIHNRKVVNHTRKKISNLLKV